jgi:hypothetical protein
MLRKVFGPKSDEVEVLGCSKQDEMGGACSTLQRHKKYTQNFTW